MTEEQDYERLADGGRLPGLNGRLRSQGRDHVYQLDRFYGEGLISEVLSLVRIGKEASVYCCRAGEHLTGRLVSTSAFQQFSASAFQAEGASTSPAPPPRSSFDELRTNDELMTSGRPAGRQADKPPFDRLRMSRLAGQTPPRSSFDELRTNDELRTSVRPSGRRADKPTGRPALLVAAKVYRARQYRFKNDAVYQEQRTRGMKGQSVRALAKKTEFGRKVQTGSWVAHEFETMKVLHEAGCDVPAPIEMDADSILMEYIGDEDGAAPQLNRVRLEREEAEAQFERVMTNVEIALACHRVHGDLSAHNILFCDGRVVLIDFPQAVDARFNSQAEWLLHRDVENVCRYFTQFGVQADAWELAHDLWRRYTFGEL